MAQWVKTLVSRSKPGFNPQDPERGDLSPDLRMLSRARFKHSVMFESEHVRTASQKNLMPSTSHSRALASILNRGASALSPSCGHSARCRL